MHVGTNARALPRMVVLCSHSQSIKQLAKKQHRRTSPFNDSHEFITKTMVILATAAITAAGIGVYKGGQAAAQDLGKKVRRHTSAKLRREERQLEAAERQQAQQREEERKQQLSAKDEWNASNRVYRAVRHRKGAGSFERNEWFLCLPPEELSRW